MYVEGTVLFFIMLVFIEIDTTMSEQEKYEDMISQQHYSNPVFQQELRDILDQEGDNEDFG